MVKLIVSDIDGTLIPYGEKALPDALFPLIHRLRRAGVLFCPASGRQFHSLRKLFAPVAEELAFLCENGAVIFGPGPAGKIPQPVRQRTDGAGGHFEGNGRVKRTAIFGLGSVMAYADRSHDLTWKPLAADLPSWFSAEMR